MKLTSILKRKTSEEKEAAKAAKLEKKKYKKYGIMAKSYDAAKLGCYVGAFMGYASYQYSKELTYKVLRVNHKTVDWNNSHFPNTVVRVKKQKDKKEKKMDYKSSNPSELPSSF